MKYVCPCCEERTLETPMDIPGEICPVCGWETDLVQQKDPKFAGGANEISLVEARRRYRDEESDEK